MSNKVTVKSLLRLIDDDVLKKLAVETNVNFKTKKLSGEVVFKLLVMSILDNTKISLRIMEKTFSNNFFKQYSGVEKEQTIRHSSISERLSVINCEYFEKIFNHVFLMSQGYFNKGLDAYDIRQYDSTSLSLSSKLLKQGMVSGLKGKRDGYRKNQIKFTVGLLNNLPASLQFYNQQEHLAEDITLRESILSTVIADNEVVVFDRGLKKRRTFKEFNDKNISFVTRINPTKSVKILEQYDLKETASTVTLDLKSDSKVYLYHKNKTLFKEPFRLIRAVSKQTQEPLYFLTNIENLGAEEITEIYKKRWDIEVFFKFIKQHLHFKHFLNYSENGIKVMMYMTMIVAILVLLYKKLNSIKSYKIAKYDFTEKLNMEIIKEIVVICDGDPSKSQLFSSA